MYSFRNFKPRFASLLTRLIGPFLALFLSFIIGGIIIAATGNDPFLVYTKFFLETLGTSYGIGQVIFKATPLMFTGLSAAIAFRAGLFNIGAEGQLTIGALFTAIAGVWFASFPSILLIPICLLAGVIGGAAWGSIPGTLKARFGAHEVINTIMMNFIAAALASYLVTEVFIVAATVHTPEIPAAAQLPRLDTFFPSFKGSPANISIVLALAACALVYYVIRHTRWGYELRAVGLNPHAAEYAGIRIGKTTITTMLAAGGLAGLVGSNFVMGYKHYFELGFSEGTGFIGIAVALLAKNNPFGIILTSLFFGILEYGGLTINTLVPKELVNIMQGIVILLLVIFTKTLNRFFDARQQKKEALASHA